MQVQSSLLSLGAHKCQLQSRNCRASIRQVAAWLAGWRLGTTLPFPNRNSCANQSVRLRTTMRRTPFAPPLAIHPCALSTFNLVKTRICGKADSTLRSSQAVPHPSTNRALCCLTSMVERDPVHSTRYGRRRHLAIASCVLFFAKKLVELQQVYL